jgi:sulfite reductase (NADPH) flavoprotein alpha-component
METSYSSVVPCLPESAPFSSEQRAYLNGFFAGLFSREPLPASVRENRGTSETLKTLTILFATQTGNSENLAKRLAREAGKRGFAPTVHELAQYPTRQLASESRLLVICSTYGDGEPPDNAKAFLEFISSSQAPELAQTRFSVCALGDSNYPKFCSFGKALDARFLALGATRIHARMDCDVDYEENFANWMTAALTALSEVDGTGPVSKTEIAPVETEKAAFSTFHRKNPFPAALVTNLRLNGPGSQKETRHFEFSLQGSGLTYEAGDALGVFPTNCPVLVAELLGALGCSGEESVESPGDQSIPFREALLRHYEITRIPLSLLQTVAARANNAELSHIAGPTANGELTRFLWGRDIVDLLRAHPSVRFSPNDFVTLLKKISPRLYSISSSAKAHPDQVHLTVNVLRYESLGRERKGVCSAFLAERASDLTVPIFIHSNKNFRLPTNPETPVIMVGPGTGIAPFRAFLHERRAVGAKGKNWLFFGEQRVASDFMYREELEAMQRDGLLTRLDTAFSRDQTGKIYVQQRMREHAAEIFAWLESGAHFYVCGDASRMAKDVDAALHEIIQTAGQCTTDQAIEYVNRLKTEKRYQRDVY